MADTISGAEKLAVDTIRTLSMDAVQQANSGHPGTPMALAPAAYVIWNQFLNYDPCDPWWPARDRFVLSCGHASALLYSLLHLAGVRRLEPCGQVSQELAISLEDLKNFRQLGSVCAGHPEYREAPGIETTTGPLGQGVANSVGMAMAGKWFAARYDQPDYELFGHNVFALCSDGDLMEGVSCEAASLAGHLKLDNLCWIYDDNHITIEGDTELAFSEDVATRFQGLGWDTVQVDDANDLDAISNALRQFEAEGERPTLIVLRSVIGFGSPNKAGTADAHGSPLGEEEIQLTKAALGWPAEEKFRVPDEAVQLFADGVGKRGAAASAQWRKKFADYRGQFPSQAQELNDIWNCQLPEDWEQGIPAFEADTKGMATRASSGKVLNQLASRIPWFIGGSADLAPSTKTLIEADDAGHFEANHFAGRNLHFGIREHAMAAACNGMALCGLRPYAGTFFVFTDYMRPAMRLASLMRLGVLYVLTHDSIGLGEDGPTHQPVEQLAACRAIPRLLVFRPADANEVAEAYRSSLQWTDRPSAIVLTRQSVPTVDRTVLSDAKGVDRGGYVLSDAASGRPDVVLIGTGSEVQICLQAQQQLADMSVAARVVSMPCFELFDEQSTEYRNSVLPPHITARVAVEAGIEQGWTKYLGCQGRFVGMTDFGASGPYQQLYEHFGITAEAVVKAANELLGES